MSGGDGGGGYWSGVWVECVMGVGIFKAVTRYTVLKRSEPYSYILINPENESEIQKLWLLQKLLVENVLDITHDSE